MTTIHPDRLRAVSNAIPFSPSGQTHTGRLLIHNEERLVTR